MTILSIFRVFGLGLLFDVGVAVFICLPYSIYLLLLPDKWNNTIVNKVFTYSGFLIATTIVMFSFFAEYTFWQEFESRFNFIAVDYLVYTYEVINNINESYPLPWLIGGIMTATIMMAWVFHKRKYFYDTFHGTAIFKERLLVAGGFSALSLFYGFKVGNNLADGSSNRYQNELAKAGIYSFFSAFKNNELNYEHFYQLIDTEKALALVRQQLQDSLTLFSTDKFSIKREVFSPGAMKKPNVIMITLESFSADFMAQFGNTMNLTPVLDSLIQTGVCFTNMYATGTRTVRGMEALSLAIPPTPGNSIVRRPNNDSLTTIGHIFQQNGYETTFFYGGDGYFDNMNQYFGNNGFSIHDRRRNILTNEGFKSPRYPIGDNHVTFENAWGICDENLYEEVIEDADAKFKEGKLFYDFVMTTSNHRPFTYPVGRINIPPGTGREGAVKYTDFAVGKFLQQIKDKPWFSNTVIIIVADHCANSAGKNEIDIAKYRIPAIICNLPGQPLLAIEKMCSQVDLYPTLFNLLGWDYSSNLYGQNVLSTSYVPRVFLGTYQKLAYMKNDSLVILSPQQKVETFLYKAQTNEQIATPLGNYFVDEAIASYQSAFYLFKNGGLKQ